MAQDLALGGLGFAALAYQLGPEVVQRRATHRDLGCDVLEASLAQDDQTVETRSFNGAWVSLWQRRSVSRLS